MWWIVTVTLGWASSLVEEPSGSFTVGLDVHTGYEVPPIEVPGTVYPNLGLAFRDRWLLLECETTMPLGILDAIVGGIASVDGRPWLLRDSLNERPGEMWLASGAVYGPRVGSRAHSLAPGVRLRLSRLRPILEGYPGRDGPVGLDTGPGLEGLSLWGTLAVRYLLEPQPAWGRTGRFFLALGAFAGNRWRSSVARNLVWGVEGRVEHTLIRTVGIYGRGELHHRQLHLWPQTSPPTLYLAPLEITALSGAIEIGLSWSFCTPGRC